MGGLLGGGGGQRVFGPPLKLLGGLPPPPPAPPSSYAYVTANEEMRTCQIIRGFGKVKVKG